MSKAPKNTTQKTAKKADDKNMPWLKSYPDTFSWTYDGDDMSVHAMLDASATRKPNQICTHFMGGELTYREVAESVSKIAERLQHLGVEKGTRVGICLPNSPYSVIAYYAILKAGGTVVNFNPLYTKAELEHQIKDSGTEMMFAVDLNPYYDKVRSCMADTTLKTLIVCPFADVLPGLKKVLFKVFKYFSIAKVEEDKHTHLYPNLLAKGAKPKPINIKADKDIAVLQYTGGTTGKPKGAMLTHRNIVSNAEQVTRMLDGHSEDERIMGVLPLFHVFAMTVVMNLAIRVGGRIILLPKFEIKQLLKAIDECKPTLFPSVPTIFNAINNYEKVDKYDLTSIEFCISGGAPLPKAVKENFEKHTGCMVVEGYGLSEASPVVSCNPRHTGGKIESIGLPLPGTEIAIYDIDEVGKPVADGQRGEVYVRGPQVMAAYWKNKEATKETFHKDWLRTGDVGYMDDEGYTFLTDRLKDVIICSGYKVYPRLIEELYYKHPAVAEVTVVGIKDDYRGEAPKAFVKLKEGKSASVDELMAYGKENLNPIERPTAIDIRKELPKTMIGKLSKKELKAEEEEKTSK